MSEEIESSTRTLDSSSETIDLRLKQETEKEPTSDETSTDELTLRSVDKRTKQATVPMIRRVEELCALLASWTEMESTGNSEAFGSTVRGAIMNPLTPRATGTTSPTPPVS